MGAVEIYVEQEGTSMRDALKRAQDKARDMYGNDYYNGRINNCSLSNDLTMSFKQCTTMKQRNDFVNERMCNADKGEVYGICMREPKADTRKIKSKVETFPQKGARKWKTAYEIYNNNDELIDTKYDQTSAIKRAREYTESTMFTSRIFITKKLVNGNVQVAKIVRKEDRNNKLGKYIFFGCAPN